MHEGTGTSNATIKAWFNGSADGPSIEDLLNKSATDKERTGIRIAYQMPEDIGGPCGRSLEDAFILANPTTFGLIQTERKEKAQEAFDLAKKENKSDFAIEYGIKGDLLNTPRYIEEGLQWLAGPVPAHTGSADESAAL